MLLQVEWELGVAIGLAVLDRNEGKSGMLFCKYLFSVGPSFCPIPSMDMPKTLD